MAHATAASDEISVNINGQTYSCSEASGDIGGCTSKANAFSATLNACMKTYNGGYCASTYWPKYKEASAACAADGTSACLKACMKTYNGGYCAECISFARTS